VGLLNPHRDDRSPRWIYPNLIDSGTSCRVSVPCLALKINQTRRPCGTGLFRTNPPGSPRRSETRLVEPPLARPRERARRRLRPRCLLLSRPSVAGEQAASSRRRIHESWRSDAFVSDIDPGPDWTNIASGRPPRAGVRLNNPFPDDRSALDSFCAWNCS
jgi:hypothetical protein